MLIHKERVGVVLSGPADDIRRGKTRALDVFQENDDDIYTFFN